MVCLRIHFRCSALIETRSAGDLAGGFRQRLAAQSAVAQTPLKPGGAFIRNRAALLFANAKQVAIAADQNPASHGDGGGDDLFVHVVFG